MSNNVKKELRKFGETTSVRGIPRAFRSTDKILRFLWIVAIIVFVSMTIWQLVMVFKKFFSYASVSNVAESNNINVTAFPHVTVCNLQSPLGEMEDPWLTWPAYLRALSWRSNNLTYLFGGHKTVGGYTTGSYLNASSKFANPSSYVANLLVSNKTVPGVDSFIVDCIYYDWLWNKLSFKCLATLVWDARYYRCLRIEPPAEFAHEVRGLTAIFYIDEYDGEFSTDYTHNILSSHAVGIKVAVHEPGTKADMTLAKRVGPATETSITVSPMRRVRLPAPYGNCTDRKYIDTKERYTSDKCHGLCQQERMVTKCGCFSPFYPTNSTLLEQAKYTMCTNQTLLELGAAESPSAFQEFAERYSCYVTHIAGEQGRCDCPLRCDDVQYDMSFVSAPWPKRFFKLAFYHRYLEGLEKVYGSKFSAFAVISAKMAAGNHSRAQLILDVDNTNLIETNFLTVNIYFDSYTSLVMADQPAMTVEMLAAAIGGTLSLWMGLTTIALVELVELLYSVLLIAHKSRKQTTPDSDVEPVDKKLPANKEWSASMNANQQKSANLDCIVESLDGEEETMSTPADGVGETKSALVDTEQVARSTPADEVGEKTSAPVDTEEVTTPTPADGVGDTKSIPVDRE